MKSKQTPRQKNGAAGLKILVTAASLTALVGGWTALAEENSIPSTGETNEPSSEEADAMVAQSLQLPPIPTLVPEPGNFQGSRTGIASAVQMAGLPAAGVPGAGLPGAGVPVINPLNGLPVVTPASLSNGNMKSESDKGGNKSSNKTPKEPTTNTRSS